MTAAPEPEVPDEPRWMRLARPYFEDSSLRPVLFALMGHVVVALVPLMLALVRHNDVIAAASLVLLMVLTGMVVRAEFKLGGRLGGFTVVAALTWVASVGLTWVCYETGVL